MLHRTLFIDDTVLVRHLLTCDRGRNDCIRELIILDDCACKASDFLRSTGRYEIRNIEFTLYAKRRIVMQLQDFTKLDTDDEIVRIGQCY